MLLGDEWYEELASGTMYETDYQELLRQQAPKLYPDYVVVRFDCIVTSDSTADSACPDLALVERGYRDWWVVEVELSCHSLRAHVEPQVRTLATGRYGPDEAAKLACGDSRLAAHLLEDMVKGTQPRVLVVVDKPVPMWHDVLKPWDARVAIFEVFRSDANKYLFRLNGDQPGGTEQVVSLCSLDPRLPSLMRIASPASLGCRAGEAIQIWHEGGTTEWARVDAADTVWLSPVSTHALRPGHEYAIVRHGDGHLELVPSVTRKGRTR